MPLEYEYRYQAGRYDKNKIRAKIEELGGVKHGHWLFRVQVFTNPLVGNNPYVRVRDEGYKITLTYKTKGNKEFVDEQEVIINDFETGVNIMLGLGCVKRYYFEKLREIWHIGNTEICWDTNPGRPDLMEIESKSEEELKKVVAQLGLTDVPHDDFKEMDTYEIPFGIIIQGTVDLTFQTAKKILGPLVTKNKTIFNKLVDEQLKMYQEVKKINKNILSRQTKQKKINKSTKSNSKKSSNKNVKKGSRKTTKK